MLKKLELSLFLRYNIIDVESIKEETNGKTITFIFFIGISSWND